MSATVLRGPERIRRPLLGGYPILYVQSWGEGRAERSVNCLAQELSMAVKGLTQDEIEHVFSKVFARHQSFTDAAYLDVLAEKEQASRKEGVLEFVPPRFTIDDIGGLDNLKEWLVKRRSLFSREA